MDIKEFGEQLKGIRKEANMTLVELSEKMGYSNPYVSQIENGKKNNYPNPEYLCKFAKCTDVDYVQLLMSAGYHDLVQEIQASQTSEWEKPNEANLTEVLAGQGLSEGEVATVLNLIENLKALRVEQ